MSKESVTISKFNRKKDYRDILDMMDEQTLCILGNTRDMTKGDPSNNYNSHPIVAGRIIGVHNGHIYNDDNLFRSSCWRERARWTVR